MTLFPQLASGATVQYPFETATRVRTLVNEAEDGKVIRFADTGVRSVRWRIDYSDLSAAEWGALRDLHAAVEGRLRPFVFFDPSANLFSWSEDFERPVWVRDPFLIVGASSLFGDGTATRFANSSPTEQRIVQVVPVPGSYQTCFSVWLRSSTNSVATLVRISGGSVDRLTASTSGGWRRVFLSGAASGSGLTTEFGIELAAGVEVEVYGAQLEVQPAPSTYKKTTLGGGIFPDAHFAEDRLECWADGPGRFRTAIEVEARVAV